MRAEPLGDPTKARPDLVAFLEREAVRENVLWGLMNAQLQGAPGLSSLRWWLAYQDQTLCGAAALGANGSVTFSRMSCAAADAICRALSHNAPAIARAFAPQEIEATLRSSYPQLNRAARLCLLHLTGKPMLCAPALAQGRSQLARLGELETVQAWVLAFCNEVVPSITAPQPSQVASWVAQHKVLLWHAGPDTPVAMAVHNRDVADKVGNIGFVYTCPKHRRQGYGARVTYALARRVLETRASLCLFASGQDPMAQRMYLRMGFEFLSDFVHLTQSVESHAH